MLCYLDAFSGISGDMLVGALADAGAGQSAIIAALASLETGAELSFERVKRCGIAATNSRVDSTIARWPRWPVALPRLCWAWWCLPFVGCTIMLGSSDFW